MFAGSFIATYTPVGNSTFVNATHIIIYKEYSEPLDIRKGLRAVNVVTTLTATPFIVEKLNFFEKTIVPVLLAIFGVISVTGIIAAILIYAMRSFFVNVARENIVEPAAQYSVKRSGLGEISDEGDIKTRKIKYKQNWT